MTPRHLSLEEMNGAIGHIAASPKDAGALRLIVRRPSIGARETIEQGELDEAVGLVGDTWCERGSSRTVDGARHPDMQLNIMNVRVIELLAQSPDRWPLAGDQLFIDLDLSGDNLPPGTRLSIGSAVIEITAQPHTGCGKFAARFGEDATRFVNSSDGRRLHFRGINAKVVRSGTIRVGDAATKVQATF